MPAFKTDPFEQARLEVANKSMGSQIAHSGIFHSIRSGFSSGGSAASKGIGAVMGVGKLFLSLIPVPIVGAVVGATVDAISGKVRGALHDRHLGDTASDKDIAKFGIKELTVENLDRYRWKVAHSFEELNQGIAAYNKSNQTCDDMYQFALLYEQVQRRKHKLQTELAKFKKVMDAVDAWIEDLEATQDAQLLDVRNKITGTMLIDATNVKNLVASNKSHTSLIAAHTARHVGCTKWCVLKESPKFDPNSNWETAKRWAGVASNFLKPIAVSSIAVRGSDYTANSDNSKFTA